MIQQHLVGSTFNISPASLRMIKDDALNLTCVSTDHGCWIPVLENPEEEKRRALNTDILLLTAMARDLGCKWIFLDSSEYPIPNLPSYEEQWENEPDPGLIMY